MGIIQDQHALITGGGSGIGAATARLLARAGARVTVLGRRADRLQQTLSTLVERSQAQMAVVDIVDAAQLSVALDTVTKSFGAVTLLVNNAGSAISAPLAKTTDELWQQMLDINLTASFRLCRALLPGMVDAGYGRIVNIASTAGLKGYGYVAAYCAAKHGVIGLTRALAIEVARKGITVNAVCPGYTDTDLVRDSIGNIVRTTGRTAAQALAELVAANPQQRLIQPDEVANTVLWLCSPGSESINGQSIAVAGGEVM